ncbi:site-specific integrase [Massilia yuzhufengensis]|jgi:integrase|nr:site-specific integrase [Massilia yuzhufengensis]
MPCSLDFTDDGFVYAGKSYTGIPVLLDSRHHFVTPVCDYLRNLVIREKFELGSVKTYAQSIQNFWNYLEQIRLPYTNVTDKELLSWMNMQEARGNKLYVIGARCDSVFDLYCWLEIHGYITNMVRVPGHNDHAVFEPMLSSKKAANGRFRRSRYGIISGIRPKNKDADSLQPTPTSEDLTKLYVVADNPGNQDLTDRNHLLIDWYGQTGVRRVEAQNLTVDQIPEWPAIDRLRSLGHAYELRLTITKGGKARHIGVLPDLLERTRDWIEGPRDKIIRRFKRNGLAYSEPKEIFVSSKTGKALTLTSMTNLFTAFFSEANVEGHGHRLRAYYLTNLLHAEVEAAIGTLRSNGGSAVGIDWDLILRKVAERAGHQNLESLRKYVTILKKKYNKISGHDDFVTIEQSIRAMKQQLYLIEHRIREKKSELDSLNNANTNRKRR